MELVFLGTGSAYPSPDRGASCIILRSGTDLGCWMFDCGEGSQVQLMKSKLRSGKLNKIFITHLHGDHMFGLPGLLCTISNNSPEGRPPVEIYGPLGLRQFLRVAFNLSRSCLGFQYVVHELHHDVPPSDIDGLTQWSPDHTALGEPHPQEILGRTIHKDRDGCWDVCHEGSLRVCAGALDHRVVCFGYVIIEDELLGRLLVDKLKSLGVPPGPLYSKIKRGESITTAEGVKILSSEVTGPPRPGRKIVILGDTRESSGIAAMAMGADVLVHEATNENALEQKTRENGHSTPAMAAKFCQQIGAKQLILTHFSQRYRYGQSDPDGGQLNPDGGQSNQDGGHSNPNGEDSVDKLVSQAKEALGNGSTVTVSAAEDFKTFTIPAKK